MATATPPPSPPPPNAVPSPAPDLKVLWSRLALFLAVIGVLGSLHLSIKMELDACALCYYQRSFMMATMAILVFGAFSIILPGVPTAGITVIALAPAVAGCAIAAEHTRLVFTGVLECPGGITGLVAPLESLIVFILIVFALGGDLLHQGRYLVQGIGAIVLGYLICRMCLESTAKAPDPTQAYPDAQIKTCRKVFPVNKT